MTLNKTLSEFMASAQDNDGFWTEQAKIDFAMALDQQRRRQNISLVDLARILGTTPAYITKVFRGDSNFTIDTMTKLAKATGARLNIQLEPVPASPASMTWRAAPRPGLRLVCGPTVTQVQGQIEPWQGADWDTSRSLAA